MATSQNGWSTISVGQLDKNPFPGTSIVPIPGIRQGDVATVLHWVGSQFNARVETLVNPGCWGYAYRTISGSSSLSNHASGTAIDLNAPKHPMGKANTFNSAQVAQIRQILDYCEGVVRWGGDYIRKDDMHFEINSNEANVARVAAKIRGEVPPPPPPPSNNKAGVIRGGTWNVRSGPGTNYAPIGIVSGGQRYDIYNSSAGWHEIRYNGRAGWVGPSAWASVGGNVPAPAPQLPVGTIRKGTWHVRRSPNGALRDGLVLGGQRYQILGTSSGWRKINFRGSEGWVGPGAWL